MAEIVGDKTDGNYVTATTINSNNTMNQLLNDIKKKALHPTDPTWRLNELVPPLLSITNNILTQHSTIKTSFLYYIHP